MRTRSLSRVAVLVASLSLSAAPLAFAPSASAQDHVAPGGVTARSLDEALRQRGMRRVRLSEAHREETFSLGGAPRLSNGRVVIVEVAGFRAQRSVFARRADGTVVLVAERPQVVVDRHVAGACPPFSGGRGWFEEVVYTLPPGTRFGGSVTVRYAQHTELVDYTGTEPDGSACPPMAID